MLKPITAVAAAHSYYHKWRKSHHPASDTTITHSKSALDSERMIYYRLRKNLGIIQENMYLGFPN